MSQPPGPTQVSPPSPPASHDVVGLVLGLVACGGAGAFLGGWTTLIFFAAGICALWVLGLVFVSAERGPQQFAPVAAGIGAVSCVVGLILTLVTSDGALLDRVMPLAGGTIAFVAFVALLVKTRSWFRA